MVKHVVVECVGVEYVGIECVGVECVVVGCVGVDGAMLCESPLIALLLGGAAPCVFRGLTVRDWYRSLLPQIAGVSSSSMS